MTMPKLNLHFVPLTPSHPLCLQKSSQGDRLLCNLTMKTYCCQTSLHIIDSGYAQQLCEYRKISVVSKRRLLAVYDVGVGEI